MGCQLEASRRETRSLGAVRDMAQLGLSAPEEGFGALHLAYSGVTLPSAYREEITSETFSTYEFHKDSSVQSSATFEARGSGLG